MSARRPAPKPLQGPMDAKIASVMSRGKCEREGQGAALRRGQLQRARKEVQPHHLSCLPVSSPRLASTTTTPDRIPLTCPLLERHDHACQRQPSRATSNPNHDRHPPSRKHHPGANRPTSRALQSLHSTAIVEQDTSQLKRLVQPRKNKEASTTTAPSAFDPLQKDTAIA